MIDLVPLTTEHIPPFVDSVVALYAEDPGPVPMTRERATVQASRLLGALGQAWPFLVTSDGVAAGHVILASFWSNEFGGPMVFLDEIHVFPSFRGLGTGRRAIARVVDWAREHGFVRVELEVNRENVRAMALYARCGFEAENREIMGVQILPLS